MKGLVKHYLFLYIYNTFMYIHTVCIYYCHTYIHVIDMWNAIRYQILDHLKNKISDIRPPKKWNIRYHTPKKSNIRCLTPPPKKIKYQIHMYNVPPPKSNIRYLDTPVPPTPPPPPHPHIRYNTSYKIKYQISRYPRSTPPPPLPTPLLHSRGKRSTTPVDIYIMPWSNIQQEQNIQL